MRRTFSFNIPTLLLSLLIQIIGSFLLWISYIPIAGQADAAPPITPSGLNTQVSAPTNLPSGKVQYDITGGTRPGGGVNLFHSFGDFNVPTNNIANFLNSGSIDMNSTVLLPNLPTSNILGRINGGNPSSIFGMIQTNGPGGFPNANLFLMNPNGFLFGPNATVNVGGMVTFTTADYMRLTDNARFNAAPGPADVLLTAAPVAAFGFLGNNPAAIAIQGSTLKVADGQSLSLVGGNQGFTATDPDTGNPISVPGGVTVTGGKLLARGGQINLASVASPGEVVAGTLDYVPNVNGQSFGELGSINISQQSVLDVSGNGGGTVLIRGGQFVLDNSTILANVTDPGPVTNGVESIGGGIDIVVSQDAVIRNGALIDTSVVGNATPGVTYGGVHIQADHIEVRGILDLDTGNIGFTTIQSNVAPGSTGGNSGDIKLEANSILVKEIGTIHTETQGSGNAGNIIMRTKGDIEIQTTLIDSDSFGGASGNAGSIELTSTQGNISLTDPTGPLFGATVTSQTLSGFGGSSGKVGNITVSAPAGNILLAEGSGIFTHIDGTGNNAGAGGIQVTAKNLTIEKSSGIGFDNFSPFQPGSLTINLSGRLSLSSPLDPAVPNKIETTTRGSARSADLNISAPDILLTNGSQVATDTFGSGDAGTLNIFTNNLQITNGAQVRSSSRFDPSPFPGNPIITPSGAGGTITIQGLASPAQSVLIDGTSSGIFTNTEGTGAGGNINILANTVTLQNGATSSASTSGTAASATGGSITVNAMDQVTMTGSASITASSTGPGNTGNIQINAGNQFAMTNSSVTTEANHSSGGIIKITTNPDGTVQLTNSTISASVLDGTGGGGSVNIDPQFVILQNSQILAQAVQGPGGNISITTNLLLPDANSVISASSQFGVNGTVTIQSPNAPASGKIQPLGKSPLLATTLLNQRCAALAGGEFSSFTVAGRDSLPAEPGSWLASPLALAGENTAGTVTEGDTRVSQSEPAEETPLLSLRQIAPAGFLTQAFAVDWSAGCTS